MARLLDSAEGYEQVQRAILMIARKNARGFKGMDFEDLVQELWIHMIEKQPEDIELAYKQLKNYCTSLFRKDCHKMGGIETVDMKDPLVEKSLTTRPSGLNYNVSADAKCYQYVDPSFNQANSRDPYDTASSSDNVLELLNHLGVRERKFVVAKGYLYGNIEDYRDEYNQMYSELTDDKKKELDDCSKPGSDDIIMKVFLNIKTGTNSGTVRSIKTNIRRAIRKFIGDNDIAMFCC